MSYHTMRAGQTRAAIMAVAERLFAERGLTAVSNRQISEAAGQGNTAAVAYHFGARTDLIRAIIREHADAMDEIRQQMLIAHAGSTNLRDWVSCAVRPITDHLAGLEAPSWYARFAAQLMTDPTLRALVIDDVRDSPNIQQAVNGLNRCLPNLPARVRVQRNALVRTLVVHACAERERDLADGARTGWDETATVLTDAVIGLLVAPVTRS
jgi:AcrR family transcriptional regulator